MPKHSEVVGCVLLNLAPFGKKESFLKKAKSTYDNFGFGFFVHYGIQFILNKFNKNKHLDYVLKKHNVPIIRLDKNINHKKSIDLIGKYKPDLLVSIAGNQIFKKPIIELGPKGCLNLHTALLPKYRGLMPTFWVLKNEEKETGVSIFFVDEGIDSGPIIVQKRVELNGQTQEELIKQTKKIGMDAINESIDKIHVGEYDLIPNPENEMSYYSRPEWEDVRDFLKSGKKLF